MRLLVHSGFFAQTNGENDEQEAKYALTPSSRLLLRHSNTLETLPFLFLILHQATMGSWETMSKWLCSADEHCSSAFEMANGKSIWNYIAVEPEFGNLFHRTIAYDSQLIGRIVTTECPEVFKGLNSMVDVGGGTGIMGKAIVEACPHITYTVFDLPQVVANHQPTTKNLSFIGGDMFEAKIPHAKAVLLKSVLYNWNDEKSIQILKNCKDAILSNVEGGKVIIIEVVLENQVEDKKSTETQLCSDVLMMANFAIRKRNEREWKNLFLAAGFRDYKITPMLGLRSLVEVYP